MPEPGSGITNNGSAAHYSFQQPALASSIISVNLEAVLSGLNINTVLKHLIIMPQKLQNYTSSITCCIICCLVYIKY
jgi:hypothetical protein